MKRLSFNKQLCIANYVQNIFCFCVCVLCYLHNSSFLILIPPDVMIDSQNTRLKVKCEVMIHSENKNRKNKSENLLGRISMEQNKHVWHEQSCKELDLFPPTLRSSFFSPLSLFLAFTINQSLLPFIRCSITVTLRMALSFLFYPSTSKGIFLSSSSFQVCTESVTLFWPPEVKPELELNWFESEVPL